MLGAREGNSPLAQESLNRLCRRYWRPIYAFIRRRGADPHEAEDLTQAFFEFLLANGTVERADREKGKFRTFLLAVATNFLASAHERRMAQKRGGGSEIVPLEEMSQEEAAGREFAAGLSPVQVFERRWATTLVSHVIARLRQEFEAADKARLFHVIERGLSGNLERGDYASWAAELHMTEAAIRVSVHRLRRRFGELLRSEIAHTVSHPDEIDGEIRQILAAIAS